MSLILRPLSGQALAHYKETVLSEFAAEKVASEGLSEEAGREAAEASWRRADPEGNPDQYINALVRDGEVVGHLWFGIRSDGVPEPCAWIYDIRVRPESRGRGIGREAMERFEETARELGVSSVGLHVFGHNERAMSLYRKLGYAPTSIVMRKSLVDLEP